MATRSSYNKNSSAVKRIMQEARELANDPCTDYTAAPLEDDIFEWHCTMRGTPGTEFEGGLYHFRILLPSEYPFRPPSIMMLTPNGRFELNTKICISFTSYHEELWQPAWGVRTAIIGLQGFFPLKGTAAVGVGALEYPTTERRRLAALSREWGCPTCQKSNHECLPDPPTEHSSGTTSSPHISSSTDAMPDVSQSQGNSSTEQQPVFKPENYNTPNQSTASLPTPLVPPTPATPIPVLAPTPTRPNVPVSMVTLRSTHASESTASTSQSSSGVQTQTQIPAILQERPPIIIRRSTPRPPIILDTAICILLVLLFALVCRRIL